MRNKEPYSDNHSEERLESWYHDNNRRLLHRLQDELGLTREDAELVLELRRQLLDLQGRVHELESELDSHRSHRNFRLTRYRQAYFEAVWREEGDE